MRRCSLSVAVILLFLGRLACAQLAVGFSAVDITPTLSDDKPVYLAGYGWNRKATGVHDPLFARAVVLDSGVAKITFVSVDVVGLQFPLVQKVRGKLPGFAYIVVSSTHNHEGPDTIGLWGKSPVRRGADDEYLASLVDKIADSVQRADANKHPVVALFGTAADESLLNDSRKPIAKDAVLRVLRFEHVDDQKTCGIVVQWNCHPEALGPDNTLITADFPYATIASLRESYGCPVILFSGAIGGLLAPPRGILKNATGRTLVEGEFEYAEAYGKAVARLAQSALKNSEPIDLLPFRMKSQSVCVPVKNPLYRLARVLGVLKRDVRALKEPLPPSHVNFTIETEVACLRLGKLSVGCFPGEIYPELIYGQFQDPQDPAADFPNAPREPIVADLMPTNEWMLFGLANDEIGYIIPKSQWDRDPPFAYGRKESQYGEINSCGVDTAPLLMETFKRISMELKRANGVEP